MKIIITENQLNNKIHQLVKELGWDKTCMLLGINGSDMKKLFFNNDPMEFLNLYKDTDILKTSDINAIRKSIFYLNNNNQLLVNYPLIWSPLKEDFVLDKFQIKRLIKIWLKNNFNLTDLNDIRWR